MQIPPIWHRCGPEVTDTYTLVGSLLVTKTIAGTAAGLRGPITITVTCRGPAASRPPSRSRSPRDRLRDYPGIPAGTSCTVTETANGSTATVAVVVSPQPIPPVTIPANGTATVEVTDTYTPLAAR